MPQFHVKHLFMLLLWFHPMFSMSQIPGTVRFDLKLFPALPPVNFIVKSSLEKESLTKNLNEAELGWFYWTNYSRNNPRGFFDSVVQPILKAYPQLNTGYAASLKKSLYSIKSLPLIKPNQILNKVALAHAVDLKSTGQLSHSSTNGSSFQHRVFSSGISRCAAENLSFGIPNTVFALVLLYLDEGVPGLGHRNNLMNPYYTEMGIGIIQTKGNYQIVVQDFACDQSN